MKPQTMVSEMQPLQVIQSKFANRKLEQDSISITFTFAVQSFPSESHYVGPTAAAIRKTDDKRYI